MGAWDKGSTRRWRRIRAGVLEENRRTNGGRCALAIPGVCTREATCVHHTVGRAISGDDPRYLVASCQPCNQHVGEPSRQPSPQPKKISEW